MCPLCIGTATLLVSSGTTAGGLGALLLGRRARRQGSSVAGLVRKIAAQLRNIAAQLPTELGSRQTRSKGNRQA
jgi:hypothetical protein